MNNTELDKLLKSIRNSGEDDEDRLTKINEINSIIEKYNKLLKKLLNEIEISKK